MKCAQTYIIFIFMMSMMTNINLTLSQEKLPDTGISGVYEVMVGVESFDYGLKYFTEFGFKEVDRQSLTKEQAMALYGVPSAVESVRMQNGDIDSHGLIRLMKWDRPLGPGVGYTAAETIGQRMAVMRTNDIFRLHDVYSSLRTNGEPWLTTEPIADDLFDLNNDPKSFFNRPVVVRENAVYGDFFNHVFFQRYGYVIPGYGTVGDHAPLQTSEITHNDFIIDAPDMSSMSYLQTVLGLKAEDPPAIDGDWQIGPRTVFMMEPGYSHWYQGFISPNNICGKLKFFIPRAPRPDRSAHQRPGEMGITMHSFYSPKMQMIYNLAQEQNLKPTKITTNEFGEECFTFKGPAGCSWQIIQKTSTKNTPVTEFKIEPTGR